YAASGVPQSVRRDHLNDYLQHKLVLAGAGPPTIETAGSYLRTAFSPLANATWQRESGYGWTMVPAEQMAGYVSAQVYALRFFSATSGQPQDHWGFAWAPRNATGTSAADFATQTGVVLDRLAAAVRDSGQTLDPVDPGSTACGPPGQNVWCVGDLEGARLTEAWKSFRIWTQSLLAFVTPAQTISAGSPSAAMNLALVTSSGLRVTTPAPLAVTLSSSSARGAFATSPAGPWSRTLSLTIAAATGTSAGFYYQDSRAGGRMLTASAAGATSGTQTVTITPGPVAALTIRPTSTAVRARTSRKYTAVGTDAYGNAAPVSAAWSLKPANLGTVAPRRGTAATFTAGRALGTGAVTATVASESATLSETARVSVTPGRLRVRSISYRVRKNALLVTTTAVDATGRPVSRAIISLLVRRDGRRSFSAHGATGPSGRIVSQAP